MRRRRNAIICISIASNAISQPQQQLTLSKPVKKYASLAGINSVAYVGVDDWRG